MTMFVKKNYQYLLSNNVSKELFILFPLSCDKEKNKTPELRRSIFASFCILSPPFKKSNPHIFVNIGH